MSFIKKAGAIAFLVLALGILPTTSHALMMTTGVDTPTTPATTIEALQAQVKALLAEIVSLKAQLGQTNTTTSLDFSINGLYFSAPVSEGQTVSLAWKTNNVENCYLYYPGKNGGTSVRVSASGAKQVAVYPSKFVSPYVGLSCTDKNTKQETHKYVTLVPTSTTQASCTISTTKTSAATGDTFTIKWTTSGITAPVMYQNVKAGGYVAVAKSGSMTWTAETGPTIDVFSIGTGGLGGINTANSPFTPLCSTKVTITTATAKPLVTLDRSSLNSTVENPTLSGTAKNISSIGISLSDAGGKAYGSGPIIPFDNGKWSHKISTDLKDGSYGVSIYGPDNALLETGTLVVQTATTPTTATYRGYMNGSLFITTNNISEADALANCKLNATNNASSAIRCTWGDKEIYSKNGSNDPVALTMPVIVGVYQGTYPAGVQSGFQYHPESTVNINIKGRATDSPQPLVLTAYEPVNWVISNPNNVPISKIVTIGYYNQRVTNIPAGVSVQSFSNQAGTDYRYTYQYQDANYKSLVNWLGTKFGYGDSGVFFGGYSGSSFDVSFGYKG